MSYSVVWETDAFDDDLPVWAVDRLQDDPNPAEASRWGHSRRRLRAGPWRVVYRIEVPTQRVVVEHVGRISTAHLP